MSQTLRDLIAFHKAEAAWYASRLKTPAAKRLNIEEHLAFHTKVLRYLEWLAVGDVSVPFDKDVTP